MIIILPLVMGLMVLVLVVAFTSFSFAMAATGAAVGLASRSAAGWSIKLILCAGAALAFFYLWWAVGSLENERGIEYAFSLMIKVTLCLLGVSVVTAMAALCLKAASRLPAKFTAQRMMPVAMFGVASGFLVLLAGEWLLNEDAFILDVHACAADALFQQYGPWFNANDFGWCIDASR
tara:strand:- start:22311 stop:22844 length:534 start_codon:yes stop_codon:yes gene_type:complete